MKKLFLSACILPAALAGCAPVPDTSSEEYLRVSTYERYTCDQLNFERSRVLSETYDLANQQLSIETGDTVALAGPVLYWPDIQTVAAGTPLEAQFTTYRETYDALTQAGINNRCLSFRK